MTEADNLYVARANGSRTGRLTRDRAHERSPAWAPGGKHVVFVRSGQRSSHSELWIIDTKSRRQRQLTHGHLDLQPSWAPSGRRIAFLRITAASRQAGIWVVRPDGSRLRHILSHSKRLTEPVWSPRGGRLLVEDGRALYSVRPDGRGRRRLAKLSHDARGAVEDAQPAWSPDGRWVVFCQLRRTTTGRSDLWTVRSDGTGLRRLTPSPGLDVDPAWGP